MEKITNNTNGNPPEPQHRKSMHPDDLMDCEMGTAFT
jgi:hypothetical protein